MNKEDKELQKHLIDEMMKVYETNPDVMIYMEALMKKYEEKEQELDRLNNVINELEKWLKEQYEFIDTISEFPTIKEIQQEHLIMLNDYENVLDKLKELKEKK